MKRWVAFAFSAVAFTLSGCEATVKTRMVHQDAMPVDTDCIAAFLAERSDRETLDFSGASISDGGGIKRATRSTYVFIDDLPILVDYSLPEEQGYVQASYVSGSWFGPSDEIRQSLKGFASELGAACNLDFVSPEERGA